MKRAQAAITEDRSERKYLVERGQVAALSRTLSQLLASHRYAGAGSNPLPRPRHFTTTIYFDTTDGAIERRAAAQQDHGKLRAREYYDLHPDLTELAERPADLLRYSPVLWLELKHKRGEQTLKQRIAIPKHEVPQFFATGEPSAAMLALQATAGDAADDTGDAGGHAGQPQAGDALAALLEFRAGFDAPLCARALTNYRRAAWQSGDDSVRVTIDLELGFYAPPADLWTARRALSRDALGEPLRVEPRAVVELKHLGEAPQAIEQVLLSAGAQRWRFSKFLQACEAVPRSL